MRRNLSVLIFAALSAALMCQEKYAEYELLPRGGREQFNQVLETQLNLSPLLLTRDFAASVKVNFDLDSSGHAQNLLFAGTENNVLRSELTRLMRFYTFHPVTLPLSNPSPYSVIFDLSTSRYKKYFKQTSKGKTHSVSPADSSMLVFTKADRSPEYYKDGEVGLREFVLSEITYPQAARDKSIQGTVITEFVVETNGFVTGVEPRTFVSAGCTEEALRIVRRTRWIPATFNGKAVRYRMTYPITFTLNSGSREIQPASSVGN